MFIKPYYTRCCKTNCCKQENNQWTNCAGCKNYTDTRNRVCITGPPKGFVQNLKDKFVRACDQNESVQPQFVKKPLKKKQKDYYCLMLRKINNLDRKLQNLEHLFSSHMNHTQNEVFNSNNVEPLYDYMDFYDSVHSLIDLANKLKQDILYKQYDNHVPNRNTVHLNHRIQVLDSELQNLYAYLEQLQSCTSDTKGGSQCYVQDCQDLPCSYPAYRGGSKVENKRWSDFKESRSKLKNKRKSRERYNGYCRNNSSCHCEECFYDEDSVSCCCSRCNLDASTCSIGPENRRYSPKAFECCLDECTAKNSDCTCLTCINNRRKRKRSRKRKNSLWVSQSTSSCSCEICISSNRKSCSNKQCNSARIKIIKPVKKGADEEDFVGEWQISYHQMEPNKTDKKKNKNKRWGNKNVNNDDQDINIVTNHFTQTGPSLVNPQERETKIQYPKIVNPANIQQKEAKNVIYYELTPDLNIITKTKNNKNMFNAQKNNQVRNKNTQTSHNKHAAKKGDSSGPNRSYAMNFNVAQENNPSNRFSTDSKRDQRNYLSYRVNNQSSSDNFYQRGKKDRAVQTKKINNSAGKHLHIKILKKKGEIEEGVTVQRNIRPMKSSVQRYSYTNNISESNHKEYDGFCFYQNGQFCPPYDCDLSESDSFETVEEYESSPESGSSQYKLFFCDDPNCVEKLDSDELIMLMNKGDLKYYGGNPYKLDITENVKDLKSDVCEKCTIKEKTIAVTPMKTKNRNNKGKGKIVMKKEVIECSRCKNQKDNTPSNMEITRTNIEFIDSEEDTNKNEKVVTSKSTGFKSKGSNVSAYQVNGIKTNKIKNQKSNQIVEIMKIDHNSQTISDINTQDMSKKPNSFIESNDIKSTVVAHSNIDQNTSFKVKSNNSSSTKALELPGFGNLININIDRGSLSFSQKPDITNAQKGTEGINLNELAGKEFENKNINSSPTSGTKQDKVISDNNMYLSNTYKLAENKDHIPRNMSNQLQTRSSQKINNKSISDNIPKKTSNQQRTQSPQKINNKSLVDNMSNQRKNLSSLRASKKSISVMDFVIKTEKETRPNQITGAKSEILNKIINPCSDDKYGSKIKEEMINHMNKDIVVSYVQTVQDEMMDGSGGKRPQPKNNFVNTKNMSLNYVRPSGKKSVNGSGDLKNSHHISEKGYETMPKQILNKNSVRPTVSTSRIKRSRLKSHKKFRPSLSRVSSAHSIIVQQGKLYPVEDFSSKKTNVFNPGRRVSKLLKHRYNGYSLRENSLSGIVKPQMKIIVQESYQNGLKIPSNNSTNSRYKVASISNYLSSTVVSESSYSTLNWEKIANKLKE